MTPQHPSDEALNEYLDDALDASARASVAAHLAACPHCAARLASLRTLFATLDALPEEPLTRDLSAGVVAHLPRPAEALTTPPKLRWVVAAQALAAVILLTIAAPFVIATLPVTEVMRLSQPALQFVTELLAGLVAQVQSLTDSFTAWREQGVSSVRALTAPVAETPALLLGAGLAAAFGLWILGNGLWLRQTLSTRSR